MLKPIFSLFLLLAFANITLAQVSGNINYQNQVYLPNYTTNIGQPLDGTILLNVKGLNNLKADAFVAVFNVTQLGKTAEEVNQLINERIDVVSQSVKGQSQAFFVDMISFVPVYEYEVEKKIFSKKTYNEIPQGFELKKNLHVKYTDPDFLETLIAVCAKAEIYDLVRVDYFSSQLEQEKQKMQEKAKALLGEKVAQYQEMLDADFLNYKKDMVDGFRVIYPVEMYQSYQAFSSASLNLNKSAKVNATDKSTTQYYQPVYDKNFDFVINPTVVEPVIQVIYEVKLTLKRPPEVREKAAKEYHIITPAGEVKKLDLGN